MTEEWKREEASAGGNGNGNGVPAPYCVLWPLSAVLGNRDADTAQIHSQPSFLSSNMMLVTTLATVPASISTPLAQKTKQHRKQKKVVVRVREEREQETHKF